MKKVIGILVGLGLGGCATAPLRTCQDGYCYAELPARIQVCQLRYAETSATEHTIAVRDSAGRKVYLYCTAEITKE